MTYPGIHLLLTDDYALLAGRRIGLLSNPSAVDTQFVTTTRRFIESPHVNLVALFSPEHGARAVAPDGSAVPSTKHPSGIPIHSLYGETYRPTHEMLEGIDLIVCDIQDVGARFYTYVWTITHILEAAGEYGVEVLILDRPNPLSGLSAGPLLQPQFTSLVGRDPIPIQHGLTLGELAQMHNTLWNPHPAALRIVTMGGWKRRMRWPETGMHWVPPSPAMPHYSTAQHYPGACLVEGTNLSEGRGTVLPFEIVGAPWIDGDALADQLNARNWQGVRFRSHSFVPNASKYAGQACQGVQAHITEDLIFSPILVWLSVIREIHQRYPADFAWLEPHAPDQSRHFDRLIGSDKPRQQINDGQPLLEIIQDWDASIAEFVDQARPFMLYT